MDLAACCQAISSVQSHGKAGRQCGPEDQGRHVCRIICRHINFKVKAQNNATLVWTLVSLVTVVEGNYAKDSKSPLAPILYTLTFL